MITSEEPTVSSTGRYTVTQTCEILGIHRNTLREYTSSGRIKCGFRRESARKFYEGTDLFQSSQHSVLQVTSSPSISNVA